MAQGKFSLALREFAYKAGDRANQACKEVMLEFSSRLILRSPVDTGRFRGNWFYSFAELTGRITQADLAEAARIFQGGDPSAATWPAELNGLEGMPARVVGGRHFITNNLPYAMALERGHSGQAPAGMVGITALEFSGIVDAAVRKVNP